MKVILLLLLLPSFAHCDEYHIAKARLAMIMIPAPKTPETPAGYHWKDGKLVKTCRCGPGCNCINCGCNDYPQFFQPQFFQPQYFQPQFFQGGGC